MKVRTLRRLRWGFHATTAVSLAVIVLINYVWPWALWNFHAQEYRQLVVECDQAMHDEVILKDAALASPTNPEAARLLTASGNVGLTVCHDYDKLTDIDGFHSDFVTGFKENTWWENHRKIHRHHLAKEDGIPRDVNLIDVLEYIADCVMAGMARTGQVYPLPSDDFLKTAFENTVELLKSNVQVID